MARKTWPLKGKRYWYVDLVLGAITVGSTDYDGTSFDDDRLNIGNCYRTKLEAEQAKDRVLAALKPVPAHETFLKKQLPDWCKVGAWVCNQNEDYFCKIIEIAKDKKSFTAAQPGKKLYHRQRRPQLRLR